MTRREQIEEAGSVHVKRGGGPSDTCRNCEVFNWAGFVTGAEWADANPSEMEQLIDVLEMRKKLAIAEQRLAVAIEALEIISTDMPEYMVRNHDSCDEIWIARAALAKIR